MKKGEGLALNTIVIAAIALIVLLIIIGIITGTAGKVIPFFGKQSDCSGRGGECKASSIVCDEKAAPVYGLKDCDAKKPPAPVCCVKQ